MPLNFPGQTATTTEDYVVRATNSKGATVAVRISYEAIQDYGLAQAKQVASAKYDANQIEADGSVLVRTTDFKK